MRTIDEIRDRAADIADDDFFGFRVSTLAEVVPFDQMASIGVTLKEEATAEQWETQRLATVDAVLESAVDYLKFAFGKAENHRGLSASRSVDRMGEYLWLLGLDTDEFEAAEYAQYGMPKLKVAADLLGVRFPESPRLVNMAEGRQCLHGTDPKLAPWADGVCDEGCSL